MVVVEDLEPLFLLCRLPADEALLKVVEEEGLEQVKEVTVAPQSLEAEEVVRRVWYETAFVNQEVEVVSCLLVAVDLA